MDIVASYSYYHNILLLFITVVYLVILALHILSLTSSSRFVIVSFTSVFHLYYFMHQGFLQARFGGETPPPKKNPLLPPKFFTDFIFIHPEATPRLLLGYP